jgi:hypothetical protein
MEVYHVHHIAFRSRRCCPILARSPLQTRRFQPLSRYAHSRPTRTPLPNSRNAKTRKIWIDRVDAESVCEQLNVPGCHVLIRVDRVVCGSGGKTTSESHYFISSLMLSARCLLRLIRGHGEVENCLHWMKDRGWKEDKHYLKRGNASFWRGRIRHCPCCR